MLELDEEDLALCTFVCPGKFEYGPLLRDDARRASRRRRDADVAHEGAARPARPRRPPLREGRPARALLPAVGGGRHVLLHAGRRHQDRRARARRARPEADDDDWSSSPRCPACSWRCTTPGCRRTSRSTRRRRPRSTAGATTCCALLGVGYSPTSIAAYIVHGALYFLPLYIVTMVVGLSWEVAVRHRPQARGQRGLLRHRHPVPADPAADDAAVAGGARHQLRRRASPRRSSAAPGMNFVNPALAARAFLFFAYPADISGDRVWTAIAARGAPSTASPARRCWRRCGR